MKICRSKSRILIRLDSIYSDSRSISIVWNTTTNSRLPLRATFLVVLGRFWIRDLG